MKSQIVISSLEEDKGYGGRRKLPFVFTEQGIAMLSAVLHSDVAIRVSIRIMDTFVEMRKYMENTSFLAETDAFNRQGGLWTVGIYAKM